MKLRHLQATAAVVLLCGGVSFGNATSYVVIGKIARVGEVKQTESDTAVQCGRVKKPIDEIYAPREVKTERNEVKAGVKPQKTTAVLQNSTAKVTGANEAKTARKGTVLALNQGGSKATQKNGNAIQAPLTSAKSRDSATTTVAATDNTAAVSEQKKIGVTALNYDVSRFTPPADVKSLIVVEGSAAKGGKDTYRETKVSNESRWNKAHITTFVKDEAGQWQAKVQSVGIYGYDGMSAMRHSGGGTTPIGLQKTDTPFERSASGEGFPNDCTHIQAEVKHQYWSDHTNRLESAVKAIEQKGEKFQGDWAKNIYAYALNTGFDKDDRQPGTGSVLFLHCMSNGKPSTTGCVAAQLKTTKMVLRQYAKGGVCIVQAPEGQPEQVHDAFSESGTATKDEFRASTKEFLATETVVLQ